MSKLKARITVTLKNGILDPQGKAIEGALSSLGVSGVGSVRQGKVFDIELSAANAQDAKTQLEVVCQKLLANIVTEDYFVEIS